MGLKRAKQNESEFISKMIYAHDNFTNKTLHKLHTFELHQLKS